MTGFSLRAWAYGVQTALLGLLTFLFGLSLADVLFGPLRFGTAIMIGGPIGQLYFAGLRRLRAWAVES